MAYSIPWRRHQMETFSVLLAICAGNSPVTGEFLSQRPVTRSFDVFFDLGLNIRLRKQSRRRWFEMPSHSLWRHCNDLIIINMYLIKKIHISQGPLIKVEGDTWPQSIISIHRVLPPLCYFFIMHMDQYIKHICWMLIKWQWVHFYGNMLFISLSYRIYFPR